VKTQSQCPLCKGIDLESINHQSRSQSTYYLCSQCDLISLDSSQLPSFEKEIDRYRHHQNEINDSGYQKFLSLLIDPVMAELPATESRDLRVLDYGCGPKLSLSQHPGLTEFSIESYDPNFFPINLANQTWDLVFCSEVFEHFREPRQEILKLKELLAAGALLAIMTQFHKGPKAFPNWWYPRDLTHFCFYSEKTFLWIEKNFGMRLKILKDPVAIFVNGQ